MTQADLVGLLRLPGGPNYVVFRALVLAIGRAHFWGIEHPVNFVRAALNDELDARDAFLEHHDRYQDCVSYLLEAFVRLRDLYDPFRSGLSFQAYAYSILRRRYTSWLRSTRGDARYGRWIGGDKECAHVGLQVEERVEAARDPENDAPRCACGAVWVSNAGAVETSSEIVDTRAVTLDDGSFRDLVRSFGHDRLSPRARETLERAGYLIAVEDLNVTEAAARLGKTRRELRDDLDRLADELGHDGRLVLA